MPRPPRKIRRYRKGDVRLSLCMIVKNEAKMLEQCLSLARPHVEEIVVIDTGSSDGTQEIARRYADVFEEIEWPNSFAKARNYSFEKATGDYILVLDGDEYIAEERDWKRLRKALLQDEVAAAWLFVRNLLREDSVVGADCMWQIRVVRNHPALRYTRSVHNQIDETLIPYIEATGERILKVEAEVVHTGYALSPELMMQKYEPRLSLLEEEFRSAKATTFHAYYGYQLGLGYYVTKRYEEAAEVFAQIDMGDLNELNAFYANLLAAQAAIKLGRSTQALAYGNAMLQLSRTEPIAYFTTGLALAQHGMVSDGLLMMAEAFNVNEAAGTAVRFPLNSLNLLNNLSGILRQVGGDRYAEILEAATAKGVDLVVVRRVIEQLKLEIVRKQQTA